MLGVVTQEGSQIDLVNLLKSFRKLSYCGKVKSGARPGHPDGWGVVTWDRSTPHYLGREPRNAYTDSSYDEMLARIEASAPNGVILAHLRKASSGSKTIENTHPFVQGNWAFAHNGTIRKLNLKVRTDSEWFFHSLMREVSSSDSGMLGAIGKMIAMVRALYNYSSMTFLMSNGSELYAYRDCTDNEDYYTLYHAGLGNSILICQEKLVEANWHELENKHLLHIREGHSSIIEFQPQGPVLNAS